MKKELSDELKSMQKPNSKNSSSLETLTQVLQFNQTMDS